MKLKRTQKVKSRPGTAEEIMNRHGVPRNSPRMCQTAIRDKQCEGEVRRHGG